jgi:hypothetical protein
MSQTAQSHDWLAENWLNNKQLDTVVPEFGFEGADDKKYEPFVGSASISIKPLLMYCLEPFVWGLQMANCADPLATLLTFDNFVTYVYRYQKTLKRVILTSVVAVTSVITG